MYIHCPTKTVYLAHPRTASKSTQWALVNQLGFEQVGPHHRGIDFVSHRHYFEWDPEELTAFCVVRDHYDAIGSWVRLLVPNIEIEYPLSAAECRLIVEEADPYVTAGRLYPLVDEAKHVARYESLDQDLNRILRDLVGEGVELPEKNVSEDRPGGLLAEFGRGAAEWVERTFEEEREKLGYGDRREQFGGG